MSRIDQLLRCSPQPLGPCEVLMGQARTCGEDGVAVVLGKTVCRWHEESAADVAALALRYMRGTS